MDYSETIAACDLKLFDLMKICEYLRSRSFLDIDLMSFIHEDYLSFLRNHWPISNQILDVSL